jgi:hypothetical protein
MDDCGFLATPPSERNRAFDVIDNPHLQVNCPWCGSREENSQQRRRGCGMWVLGMLAINEEDDYSRGAALWDAGLALAREGGGMNSVESSAGAGLPRAGGCLLRGSTGCKPAGRDKTDCHQHLGGDGRSGRGREEGHPSGAPVGGCGSGARGHRRCFATPRADAARAPPGFGSFPAWGDDMGRRSGRGTSYVTRSGR